MADETPVAPAATAPTGEPAENVQTNDQPAAPAAPAKDDKSDKLAARQSYHLRETRRQLRETHQELSRLRSLVEAGQHQPRPTEQAKAPKVSDYENLDEFFEARDKYLLGKLETEKPQQPREQPREQGNPRWDSEVDALMSEGDEKYEGFSELLSEDIGLSNPMKAYVLMDADNRADLAYHLANNPKEVRRISRLSPGKQIAELARLDDKFSQKPAPQKKPSNAPAPVEPVGGAKTEVNGSPSNYKDFVQQRRKGVKLADMIK